MADLTVRFAGMIESPNPFWLASGPPTNSGEQVMRAFDAGWGGAVWKTIGEPIVNVASRYSAVDWDGAAHDGAQQHRADHRPAARGQPAGDREVKKRYPKHAVIASLMVESKREAWHEIVSAAEDAGADGLELNFGCPHGMCERGMGSAVGQVPEYTVHDHRVGQGGGAHAGAGEADAEHHATSAPSARAAKTGGADGLSLINTINSITGIDLDTLAPRPNVGGQLEPRRLLRPGGEADRAAHGAADRGRSARSGFRSRASAASRAGATRRSSSCWAASTRAGVHGGDALRLSASSRT